MIEHGYCIQNELVKV